MKQTLPNKPEQVFEMILQTAGELPAQAAAQPSNFALPANWHESQAEGQLAVDVGQTDKEVVVVTTMAGSITDKIEVYINNDLLTIRGLRYSPVDDLENIEMFHQECFWGKFSRTIVLPVDVRGDTARAEYKNGVLTIFIQKQTTNAKVEVIVVDD